MNPRPIELRPINGAFQARFIWRCSQARRIYARAVLTSDYSAEMLIMI